MEHVQSTKMVSHRTSETTQYSIVNVCIIYNTDRLIILQRTDMTCSFRLSSPLSPSSTWSRFNFTSLFMLSGYFRFLHTSQSSNAMDIEQDKQRESWKQGCRAVFAGFVASAHPRGVRPQLKRTGD
jgi:hypothetical protein